MCFSLLLKLSYLRASTMHSRLESMTMDAAMQQNAGHLVWFDVCGCCVVEVCKTVSVGERHVKAAMRLCEEILLETCIVHASSSNACGRSLSCMR